jgi:hypothetical protein
MNILIEQIAKELERSTFYLCGDPDKNTYAIPNTKPIQLDCTLQEDPNKTKYALGIATKFSINVAGSKILISDTYFDIKRTGYAQLLVFIDSNKEVIMATRASTYKSKVDYLMNAGQPTVIIENGTYVGKHDTAHADNFSIYIDLT